MPEGTVEALDGVETDLGVAGPAEVSVGHVGGGGETGWEKLDLSRVEKLRVTGLHLMMGTL